MTRTATRPREAVVVKDIGPLDWKDPIVDPTGRPSPEFQRRWNQQRANNSGIGIVAIGAGPPPADPTPVDGQEYVDVASTPLVLYVGSGGDWSKVGVLSFVQLSDVPGDYTGAAGQLLHVKGTEDGLGFIKLSDLLDALMGSTEGDLLVRGPSAWEALAAGTLSDVLTSAGPGAVPSWQPASGGGGGGMDYYCDPTITKSVPGSLTSSFSTNSTGSTAFSADRIVMGIPSPSSGNQGGFLSAPYPGADFVLTVQLMLHAKEWNSGSQYFGLAVQDTTGKFFHEAMNDQNSVHNGGGAWQYVGLTWPNLNSGNTITATSWWQAQPYAGIPVWMRLIQNSGTFTFAISQDGLNWRTLGTDPTSRVGTLANVGVLFMNSTSGLLPAAVSVYSWSLTP